MTLPWWERTWPEDEGRATEDEPAEHERADEEADRVERDAMREW